MKKLVTAFLLLYTVFAQAQVGIGTTSPTSTLDVRGSMAINYRAFSSATSAATTDNVLVFTGSSATTLTLPDATACTGRMYNIKNVSSNSSTLTIATTSSQTIDGLTTWTLTQTNKAIIVVSNGTNWYATSESLPGNSSGTSWLHGGNNVSSIQNLGTTSNYALPFITNNTEKMRLTTSGSLGVGTSTFNGTYPEKLLVDAGTTTSVNAIVGKGSINSYLQLNIQNQSTGTSASSDVVATADNGDETINYVDMGINGSAYSGGVMGAANDAYLYNLGQNFLIGTGTASKSLVFMTGGTSQSSYERMRIDGSGNVGIGTTTPAQKLDISGNINFSGALMANSSAGTSGYFLKSNGAGTAPAWVDITGYSWALNGNSVASTKTLGTTSAYDLPFITNNTEKMRITSAGSVGIGTTTFSSTNAEKLIVDAGTNGSGAYQNVIVGKGNTNSYAQLNIQNYSTGTAASSDVVATADNGNETVNFIDMGVNGSGNTSTGILSGANTAYLYTAANDFVIGNSTDNKNLIFYTTTSGTSTERMRIMGTGNVGINTNSPTAKLDVAGTYKLGTSGTVLTNLIKTNFSVTDNTTFTYTSTRQVTATVTGATVNGSVILNPRSALPTGIGIGYVYVSSANTITIGFTNTDGTARAVGTVTFDITIIQ